jgi:hypothetical protein
MTRYVRINDDNQCAEFIDFEPHVRFHPSIRWLPVPEAMEGLINHNYIANGDTIEPPSLDYLRDQLKSALAAHRFEIETGGVALPDGSRILTDRESQAQLTSAFQTLTQPFVEEIERKAAGGWVTVTEVELRPIAQAVAQHVQVCFKAERRVSEQIDAAEGAEALYAMDIAGAFEEELEIIKAV